VLPSASMPALANTPIVRIDENGVVLPSPTESAAVSNPNNDTQNLAIPTLTIPKLNAPTLSNPPLADNGVRVTHTPNSSHVSEATRNIIKTQVRARPERNTTSTAQLKSARSAERLQPNLAKTTSSKNPKSEKTSTRTASNSALVTKQKTAANDAAASKTKVALSRQKTNAPTSTLAKSAQMSKTKESLNTQKTTTKAKSAVKDSSKDTAKASVKTAKTTPSANSKKNAPVAKQPTSKKK
jgi:hypothetical protein